MCVYIYIYTYISLYIYVYTQALERAPLERPAQRARGLRGGLAGYDNKL